MPIHLVRTPPINTLVEYSDNDEQSSDPEDVLLESLVSPKPPPGAGTISTLMNPSTVSTTATAATATITAGTGPRVGSGGFVLLHAEKSRCTEEDKDEMGLERLVGSKTKCSTKIGTTGAGEETPKCIQLRFGMASLAAASSMLPTAACSESGAKDSVTGLRGPYIIYDKCYFYRALNVFVCTSPTSSNHLPILVSTCILVFSLYSAVLVNW